MLVFCGDPGSYDCALVHAVLTGSNMRTLKAPKQTVFLVSQILAILAWITAFIDIEYIGGHPSILMTVAYIVLALGCLL